MKNRAFLKNALLVIVSIGATFLVLEIFVRALTPGVGFAWRNFTYDPINMVTVNKSIRFDDELGYVLAPNGPGIGPYGFRPNGPQDTAPPEDGAILAVGDSFTFGSDVLPQESWPAQLEHLLAQRVINGGIGGYGIDQIVLYAERLVGEHRPKLLIVSFIPDDIDRAEMSVFSGASKPHFVLNNGNLELRNVPVPPFTPSWRIGVLRRVFGYSYLAAWTFDRLGLGERWRIPRWENVQVHHDGRQVACLLMRRLATLAATNRLPTVVLAQYAWNDFLPARASNLADAREALTCARDSGLKVVDTFDSLKARIDAAGGDVGAYYVNGVGHMTAAANGFIARMVADAVPVPEPAADPR